VIEEIKIKPTQLLRLAACTDLQSKVLAVNLSRLSGQLFVFWLIWVWTEEVDKGWLMF